MISLITLGKGGDLIRPGGGVRVDETEQRQCRVQMREDDGAVLGEDENKTTA